MSPVVFKKPVTLLQVDILWLFVVIYGPDCLWIYLQSRYLAVFRGGGSLLYAAPKEEKNRSAPPNPILHGKESSRGGGGSGLIDRQIPPKEGVGREKESLRVQAEAFWAEPFGVARVSLVLPAQAFYGGPDSLVVSEPKDRVFYPAVDEGPLRAFLREKTGLSGGRITVYFLFTGKEPLEVRLRAPGESWAVRLIPSEHPRMSRRLLEEWWECFTSSSQRARPREEIGWVEEYLQGMLARRLGLDATGNSEKKGILRRKTSSEALPLPTSPPMGGSTEEGLAAVWSGLVGGQRLREQVFRDRLRGRDNRGPEPLEYSLPEPAAGGSVPTPWLNPPTGGHPPTDLNRPIPPPPPDGRPQLDIPPPPGPQKPTESSPPPALNQPTDRNRPIGPKQPPDNNPPRDPEQPSGPNGPIQIEPLASRVPEECFYIRLGSMGNFAWFREFLDWTVRQWTMCVSGKGLDYQRVQRSEERLCLRPTGWSKLLGPHLGGQVENLAVADVALIGLDLFQPEGSALGVLFQARSEKLLREHIQRQRSEAVRTGQGKVHEEKVLIEGREVSLLTSEDGKIRSFYAVDGSWHLVSTSRRLVERFFQTRSGQGALAGAADFRAVRAKFPPQEDQTAFWYLSEGFWRNLSRAAYQVEMRRRWEAEADIVLVEFARQAAVAEGRAADSIAHLQSQGFLPPQFGPRSDGSRTVLKDGHVGDSLRGRRGYFTPIADIEVSRITGAEARQVEASTFSATRGRSDAVGQWPLAGATMDRMPPMAILFRRSEPTKGMEQIRMEIDAYPLQSAVLEMLGRLFGSAGGERVAPPAGDGAFAEWQLPQGRLFLGIRAQQPAELRFGRGKLLLEMAPPTARLLLEAMRVGYVGRQGETPLLEALEKLLAGRPDPEGYTGKPGGLWRRQIGPFVLYSFHRDILAEVGPLLRLEKAPSAAQLRVQIQDPSNTPLGRWLTQLAYQQAQGATLANLRLLSLLENQFHLSGQAGLEAAQGWLQARLVCPLGGRYEYRDLGGGGWHWVATALTDQPGPDSPALPPPIAWFRGLEGWARWQHKQMHISLEILRQKEASSPGTAKPAK